MLRHRAVIPAKLRSQVLSELHEGHLGIVKMKSLARSYNWWPKIDKDFEHLAESCPGCQLQQNEAGRVQLHPWEWPTRPWQRIHLDFAGPFLGRMFLIIVDACTSRNRQWPHFTSVEFQLFLKTNGIKHITTAPFHPATNGQAERFVQSFKHAMKCQKQSTSPLQTSMAKFLLAYRNTAHSTMGEPLSVLFLGRPLRTRLELVKPDLPKKVMNRQIDQAKTKKKPIRQFSVGQTLFGLPGTVQAKTGPLSYEIKVGPNQIWRRHIDQLLKSNDPNDDTANVEREEIDAAETCPALEDSAQNIAPAEEIVDDPDMDPPSTTPVVQQEETSSVTTGLGHRYHSRSHQPPERLGLNWLL